MLFEGNIWLIEISFISIKVKKNGRVYSSYVMYIFG